RFPTCPSINFGCPSDMELGVCLNFQLSVNLVTDSSPTNPKRRLLIEVFKTFLKVIRGQSQIAVKLHDELPVIMAECTVTIIKCFYDAAAGLAESPIRPVDHANPWKLGRVLIEDVAGSVARTVVNNDPLRGRDRLGRDGSDSCFDMPLFVTYRSDDYILNVMNHDCDRCNMIIANACLGTLPDMFV